MIGTGATAVQAIPQVAEWAKELIVFQRTPSSVDVRGQHLTDTSKWTDEVAFKKGWQRERLANFDSVISNGEPAEGKDLIKDGWSNLRTYHALIGGPSRGIIPYEKIPEEVGKLHQMDVERTNRVRARVDQEVHHKTTAGNLKAWYPTWCKRPCFHDDYLPAFNRPNVRLVDTDGKGVERITEHGLVVNGQEYPVDLLILSTGFRGPGNGSGSPASRSNLAVTGRDGKSMDDKWIDHTATLHGVVSHDFPNFFYPGPSQLAATANQMQMTEQAATHVAYIIAEAEKVAKTEKFSVEPSVEAEEGWTGLIMRGAGNFAALVGCTPSYLTGEGVNERKSIEEQMKAARGSIWPEGMGSFIEVIEGWRTKGGLEGIEVKV